MALNSQAKKENAAQATQAAQEELKAQQKFHEMREEKRKETRRAQVPDHMLEWAETNKAACEGRVGKLLTKFDKGTLKSKAFKRAIEILKQPDRDDDDTKKLLDHLIEGNFPGFGKNFETIADAFESNDKDIRNEALRFVRLHTMNGVVERKFIRKVKEIKRAKMSPEELAEATKKALEESKNDTESTSTSIQERAVELTDDTGYGLLSEPPESVTENYPKLVRRLIEDLNTETAKLKEIGETIKAAQTLTTAKKSLRQKLEQDPDFATRLTQTILDDYELLKRTAVIIKRVDQTPEIAEALRNLDVEQAVYYSDKPQTFAADESPYSKFMQAKESTQTREALTLAIEESLPRFTEVALELDLERAIDEEIFTAHQEDREVGDNTLNQAITAIQTKYELTDAVLDEQTTAKLQEKANEVVAHEKEHAGARREYLKEAMKLRTWAELDCLKRKADAEMLESMAGIKLTEERDGWGVFPRQVRLQIDDYEQIPLAQRAGTDELDPNIQDKTFEIEKGPDGKAKLYPKEVTAHPEFMPQDFDEEEGKRFREENAWRPEEPRKPLLKVVVEDDGKEDRMGEKEFLGWAAMPRNAHEIIKDTETLEALVKEGTGLDIEVKPGAKFINEMNGEVIAIKDIDTRTGTIILEEPITYRHQKELLMANSINTTQTRRRLSFGELYSLLIRKNAVPLNIKQKGKAATIWSSLTADPKPFLAGAGIGTTTMTWLYKDGTSVQNPAFAGKKLSDSASAALAADETFAQVTRGPNGKHFVRRHIPGARLMSLDALIGEEQEQDQNQNEEEQEIPIDENPMLTDEQKEELKSAQEKEAERKEATSELEKKSTKKEALTSKETGTEGEAHITEVGFLMNLWRNTRVLATDDIWGLMKSCYEHYERRWHRRSKEKYGNVGKNLPLGFGTELNRVKQQAEDEEVNQNMEAMENWGVWEIQDAMRNAYNKDQLKACFQTLSKKGHLRWDDIEMWKKLNEFVPNSLRVPIPPGHDPNFVDKRTKKTGLDYLEGAIDYIWGESTYQEWHTENNSTYNQRLKQYWEKGKQLEGDPKHTDSVVGELAMLLTKHKRGEYVDPHEYEGLIHFIIDYGKGNMEAKVYYIVQGVAAKNPTTGETLLGFDRVGSINGDYLNRLPFMDYLTRRDVPRPDGKEGAWTTADFRNWCAEWDSKGKPDEEGYPPAAVTQFVWEHVLTDERTIIRNNKGLRKAEEMDHDDAHFIIPLADEDLVTNICQSASGSKRYFTTEGYNNAYPGYNQYSLTLAERGEKAKLLNTIRSFARFNSIMDGRYKKEQDNYARLGPSFWHRPSVVDDRYTGWHKKQMEELIRSIALAYGDAELINTVDTMHIHTESISDQEEAKKQKKVQAAIDNFGKQLEKAVKTDGGDKMINVVNNFGLTGMPKDISPREKQQRKKMYKEGEDELSQTFNDWQADKNY